MLKCTYRKNNTYFLLNMFVLCLSLTISEKFEVSCEYKTIYTTLWFIMLLKAYFYWKLLYSWFLSNQVNIIDEFNNMSDRRFHSFFGIHILYPELPFLFLFHVPPMAFYVNRSFVFLFNYCAQRYRCLIL